MIYVKYSSPDVSLNLAAEYYFATEHTFDEDVFMLWQPRPTIVVGNFQNIHEEVDVPYAISRGIDIVRRLSGGGTVYQDEGSIQFAFIEKREGDIDFRRYLEPICTCLRELGIDAEINGRNDVTVDGKKVSGNSQYRAGGKTVHHGTLLFSVDIDEMVRATTPPDYKISSKGIKSVRSRVANMCDYTDRMGTASEFMEYIARFMTGDNVYVPTEDDLRRIEEIANERFRAERQGNLSVKSPKFDFERVCTFKGGTVVVGFKVTRGVISGVSVKGDFFTNDGTESLVRTLTGCSFTRENVKRAVLDSGFSAMGITLCELAEKLSEGI